MGSVKDYYCAACGWTGERVALVADCPAFTQHCPMRNKVEQVDEADTPPDPTNPDHYRQGDIECIEAIKAATIDLTGEQAYCTGCAIKYLWRWKRKGGTEDLRKARWYLSRLIGD